MKMVSAAKFAKAERELRVARSYGLGSKGTKHRINSS
jgi:F0F1-type ATP synthase gamma subunit